MKEGTRLIAKELGKLISETEYYDLPIDIVNTVKSRLLDFLGIVAAGYRLGTYKVIMDVLGTDKGKCTILCDGQKTSVRNAAIINSFMSHSSYYEDGSRITGGHPSTAMLPALLALGEERKISGKKLILGMVVGYEVFNRIGSTLYPSAVNRGFQPTPILAPLAAASACAKIMDLDGEKTFQALNIAAPLGAGLKSAFKEAMVQPIQVGRSCEGGLTAALFAERGLLGYGKNLEFFLTSHGGNIEKQVNLANWGKEFEIKNTYVKIHGGCRGNHAPLDVVLDIISTNSLNINDIESIKVIIDNVTAANEIHNPKNKGEAQFNIPFSIAVALVNGDASLFQFTDENLKDERILAMMDRVSIEIDPELDKSLPDKRGAGGEIVLKNGQKFISFIDMPKGEPERPLSQQEIEGKFIMLSKEVMGKRVNKIIDMVWNLDNLYQINDLIECLTK